VKSHESKTDKYSQVLK